MALVSRLFKALGRTRANIAAAFSNVLSKRISEETLEELEEILLTADMGIKTVDALLTDIRKSPQLDFRAIVTETLNNLLPTAADLPVIPPEPTVLMVVGVNGTGKTTSVAKLAAHYRKLNKNILIIGADTYRAAAVEQLTIWSERLGIRLICNEKSADPSAVLFDGLNAAHSAGFDLIIVDTAGRLHTYDNLMAELDKMYSVITKRFSHFKLISFITIDSTLGQNSVIQAKTFASRVKIDGAILTKLDGTAKGGIVFPLFQELNIPTVFTGIGEQIDDLYQFNSREYVESLFGLN